MGNPYKLRKIRTKRELRKYIRSEYDAGKNVTQVAKGLGCSVATISYHYPIREYKKKHRPKLKWYQRIVGLWA